MLNEKVEKRNCSQINCFGLFAKEKILKDELIWSTTNETVKKITISEFHKLSEKDQQNWIDHCYQIHDYFQMDIDNTRFMNHSCEPNTLDYPNDDPSMIVASRDIDKDEEVTWNYLPFMNPFQVFSCKCGSKNCVGVVKKNAIVKSES